VAQVLLAVPLVSLACWAGAVALRRMGQPAVIGELVAGMALGPSLLGRLAPGVMHHILPAAVLPVLGDLGQLGLIAFIFLVGYELDFGMLRGQGRATAVVSSASVTVPLAAGAILAMGMYSRFAPHGVQRPAFVLFLAVAMAITAFPVLARIVSDRGIDRSATGTLALTCAAINDTVAWCLLAVAAAVATAGSVPHAVVMLGYAGAFVTVMLCGVRPLLAQWARRAGAPEYSLPVLLLVGACFCGLITTDIGVSSLLGAFVFGLCMPRRSQRIELAAARLDGAFVPVLLPLYFVSTGLNADMGLLGGATLWLWLAAVVGVAVLGKFSGTVAGARAVGRSWHESLALGTLMNCRGLTELIVLNTGLQLGVISSQLFTMLVLMALLTTAATGPALDLIGRVRTTVADADADARGVIGRPVSADQFSGALN
jgi:Kef-type K+ transport system membrane component KefB